MNPNTVLSASLVTSLVLWLPSMQACLRGDLDLAPAGLRYLAALFVSRLAMGGLARLVAAYHPAARQYVAPADADGPRGSSAPAPSAPAAPASPAPAPAAPQRRRGDRGDGGDADPGTLAA